MIAFLILEGLRDGSRAKSNSSTATNTAPGHGRLDITTLDEAVRFYCHRCLADSTHKTYRAGLNWFLSFCNSFYVNDPFPVSESLLCYFVVSLARQGLAPTTIRTYLAAVCHAQIKRGFPKPRQSSSLLCLRLVQSGVRRERGQNGPPPAECLAITPPVFHQIRAALLVVPPHHDKAMIWAAASACFFGFFQAGEITVPSVLAFDPTVHLAWGDVSIDSAPPPVKDSCFSEAVEDRPVQRRCRRCSWVQLVTSSAQ